MLEKNIFLLWLQGWKNAEWLNKHIAESWEINNPDWKIHYVDIENLKNYTTDIDYIYDSRKHISPQAKSDIIRLSLLKKYGGVWAEATTLCMQPLDHWIHEAIEPTGLWMYHGDGSKTNSDIGPARWFIISKKDNYIISKWKEECDKYWLGKDRNYGYYWMDELFKNLVNNDEKFKNLWLKVPYLYCESDGQSNTLAHYGMHNNTPHIKNLFTERPPYALKLWKDWNHIFPDVSTQRCINSNGYWAIQMSKRKYIYKHEMNRSM